jgi:hypothetical protein
MRLPILLAAALAGVACAPQIPESPILPVVGHWEVVTEDGEVAVVADARKWDGASGPDLVSVARRLFPKPDTAFAENMHPATAFAFAALLRDADFRDGTIRGRFKLVGGESDQIAGFAFGLQPNGDYHYVRYNTKDGNLAVWEFVGGKRHVLKHGEHHAQIPLDTWHELVITVDGRLVRGEMAGGFLVEHELPRPVTGRLGLWAKRDSISRFRLPHVLSRPH